MVRVAFVHHALHMGGVERQIELTWQVFKCWCPRADQPVLCLHTHTHTHTHTHNYISARSGRRRGLRSSRSCTQRIVGMGMGVRMC